VAAPSLPSPVVESRVEIIISRLKKIHRFPKPGILYRLRIWRIRRFLVLPILDCLRSWLGTRRRTKNQPSQWSVPHPLWRLRRSRRLVQPVDPRLQSTPIRPSTRSHATSRTRRNRILPRVQGDRVDFSPGTGAVTTENPASTPTSWRIATIRTAFQMTDAL
jgi:hypothetical protein